MTINETNVGVALLIRKVKCILRKEGALGGKQILISLLGDPDINKYRIEVGDKELKETLRITTHRLLRLNLIQAELSFDLEDIDSKTVYCLSEWTS